MIFLSIYLFGFVFTLIICYRDELKNHDGDEFLWCWGFALVWPFIWPIYLAKYTHDRYTFTNPMDKFHKYLRQRYGRKA